MTISPLEQQALNWIEQHQNELITLCADLVRCPTPSDVGDTREAMAVVQRFMNTHHLPYEILHADEIMPNLLAEQTMSQTGKRLMWNGHLDVMPAGREPNWRDAPFSGKIRDGKIWGRGTQDMKGGVAAMLFAYACLSRFNAGLAGQLALSLVSDEETGEGRGTGFLFETRPQMMQADCVLSAEPSGVDAISYSSKGYLPFSVAVQTRGAIAGYGNESPSAIEIAAQIMQALKFLEMMPVRLPELLQNHLNDDEWQKTHRRLRGKGHAELLGQISVDFCTIQGGSLHAVIAPDCVLEGSVVMPVGTDCQAVIAQMQAIVARYPQATLTIYGYDEGELSDPNDPMVAMLQQAVVALGKKQPEPTPDVALSDCRYWRYRGIPAFWYGSDGSLCSKANENIKIDELVHLAKTYVLVGMRYLAGKSS